MGTYGLKCSNLFLIYLEYVSSQMEMQNLLATATKDYFSKLFSFIKHIKTYKVGLLMYLHSHKLTLLE